MPAAIVLGGHEIRRDEIGRLMNDPDLLDALMLYARYRKYGWPWPGTWRDQSARVFDMVETLDYESTKIVRKKK